MRAATPPRTAAAGGEPPPPPRPSRPRHREVGKTQAPEAGRGRSRALVLDRRRARARRPPRSASAPRGPWRGRSGTKPVESRRRRPCRPTRRDGGSLSQDRAYHHTPSRCFAGERAAPGRASRGGPSPSAKRSVRASAGLPLGAAPGPCRRASRRSSPRPSAAGSTVGRSRVSAPATGAAGAVRLREAEVQQLHARPSSASRCRASGPGARCPAGAPRPAPTRSRCPPSGADPAPGVPSGAARRASVPRPAP